MSDRVRWPIWPGEHWWGGAVRDGAQMPFRADQDHPGRDLTDHNGNNQTAPLLLSDRGRHLWSETAFAFSIADGHIETVGGDVTLTVAGTTLAQAYRDAATRWFAPTGAMPAAAMFSRPIYNTWIEMEYMPTQGAVLAYVEDLLAAGFPPGVVMIDAGWSAGFGDWRFDPVAFPDPRALVERLHALGCPVMLWLVPFVDPSVPAFRALADRGLLVRDTTGAVAVRRWWAGRSGVLDCTDPAAVRWLHEALDELRTSCGVDGFKFDGGDLYCYRPGDRTAVDADPPGQLQAWARVGVRYPFNEYRACWKMSGRPLAQRLHDKPPTWGPGGLASLIPETIVQGLLGYPYACPDMIGGGEQTLWDVPGFVLDEELFVRYAQVAALMPIMQFSASPVRLLGPTALAAVRAAVALHEELAPEILALAASAAITGEPIVRPLEYHHPGHAGIVDQFLVGENILAAPVLEPGVRYRAVVFPAGRWVHADGTVTEGPAVRELAVALTTVPWFRRLPG